MTSCLDIPLPQCIQRMLHEPPVCRLREEDARAVALLELHGKHWKRDKQEIDKACDLATGPSDLVIILLRPQLENAIEKTPYSSPFGDFVAQSPTLRRVDELIRVCSKGTRSIHTVTVLDAFSYQTVKPRLATKGSPAKEGIPPAAECLALLERILKLKQPKVVISCWNEEGPCNSLFLQKFRSTGVGGSLELVSADSTTIIRSFHPSYAINFAGEQKAYARMLLTCHFTLAFRILAGLHDIPPWVMVISKGAAAEGKEVKQREKPRGGKEAGSLNTATLLGELQQALSKQLPTSSTRVLHPDRDAVPLLQQKQQIGAMVAELLTESYDGGGLQIARICLRWKQFDHPKKEEIMRRLVAVGNRQAWFQNGDSFIRPAFVFPRIHVGFGDNASDELLNSKAALLTLQDDPFTETPRMQDSITRNEDSILLKLRKQMFTLLTKLRKMNAEIMRLTAILQIDLDLQLTQFDSDKSQILLQASDCMPDMFELLDEIVSQMGAIPALIMGDYGPIEDEEQPKRAICQRSDFRKILDDIILYTEPLVIQALSSLRCFSALLAHSRVVSISSAVTDDDEVESFQGDHAKSLADRTEDLMDSFRSLLAIRLQLDNDGSQALFRPQNAPLPRRAKETRNLKELFQTTILRDINQGTTDCSGFPEA